MEKQQHPPRSSLVDMSYSAGIHPLYDISSPLYRPPPSIDNCTTSSSSTSQSRRNSNDNFEESGLCSVFDKLKVEDRRNSCPQDSIKQGGNGSHRSMSVDVGSMQHNKIPTNNRAMLDTPTPSNLLSRNHHLLFDADPRQLDMHHHPFTPPPPPPPPSQTLPLVDPYLSSRYAGSTDKYHSSTGLFSTSPCLDFTSSVRRNSCRQNRSVDSLRSKSWAQYLENASTSSSFSPSSTEEDSYLPTNARAQAAFYGSPRRFSYGWPEAGNGKSNCLPTNMKSKNSTSTSRLATSHSYSDLHGTALRPYHADHDLTLLPCPQYHQHGFCMLQERCPYAHHTTPSSLDTATDHTSVYAAYPYSMLQSLATHTTSTTPKQPNNTSMMMRPPPPPPPPTMLGRRTSSPITSLSSSTDDSARFAGATLDDFRGQLYELCKDQNGCRFLQKKLEEPDDEQHLQMILDEVQPYFVELMTEPFGNYLCQKLIEHCDDDQRNVLVDTVAPDILRISLNMHGTRAVQRLIEFISTPHQIYTIIAALDPNVVTLIKDLNGNHVIQKCLHRLSVEHKQFVYDAVSEHCIQVGTHRHGCCVLQRCIDYASEAQKDQLVKVITWHALPLVQDPFGNYVVQYVLDLGDITYTDTLVRCFLEHVCDLSVQKFSSNVIEKCIRVAEPETRRLLVAELMNESSIEKLLRDSFANYVVQTCLEYADEDQRSHLIELIRPLLPSIRSTPYGKRISSKIQREQSAGRHGTSMRQHQSLGSLRYKAASTTTTNNHPGATSSSVYNHQSNGYGNSLVFGLPILGNSASRYPYHNHHYH
ncbi:arm repeat-containing protein [Lichtheimia corymbifera JMRC:FSU:9682]|uniref:Arm repeat-containing protein n=1 Tax=Lichtheimia corymbifera JMRC:FSU:9682 TaxID=1263082 RepID=A0A068SBN0_9FUNG|nr:arm repeat-containing protein [Lichtheimia corymbifera JMRC:FSU:9682]